MSTIGGMWCLKCQLGFQLYWFWALLALPLLCYKVLVAPGRCTQAAASALVVPFFVLWLAEEVHSFRNSAFENQPLQIQCWDKWQKNLIRNGHLHVLCNQGFWVLRNSCRSEVQLHLRSRLWRALWTVFGFDVVTFWKIAICWPILLVIFQWRVLILQKKRLLLGGLGLADCRRRGICTWQAYSLLLVWGPLKTTVVWLLGSNWILA